MLAQRLYQLSNLKQNLNDNIIRKIFECIDIVMKNFRFINEGKKMNDTIKARQDQQTNQHTFKMKCSSPSSSILISGVKVQSMKNQ